MVLLALALTNAAVVGALFIARRQSATARFDGFGAALQPAAERGIIRSIIGWDSLSRAEQPVTSTVVDAAVSDSSGTVWITRTSAELYWIVAESWSHSSPRVSRRVNAVVRLDAGRPTLAFPRSWAELP
jgi:hypothetical protein